LAPQAALEDPQTLPQTSSVSTQGSRTPRTNSSEQGLEVDVRFSVLVECFRAKRYEDGTTRIHSSELAKMMLKRESRVYTLAGVRKLRQYLKLARSEAIITSPIGDRFIELNPRLYAFNQVEDVQTQTIPSRSPNTATSILPPSPFEGPEWTDTESRRGMGTGDVGEDARKGWESKIRSLLLATPSPTRIIRKATKKTGTNGMRVVTRRVQISSVNRLSREAV